MAEALVLLEQDEHQQGFERKQVCRIGQRRAVLLERYLQEDLAETERAFAGFVRDVTGVDPASP